MNKYVVEKGFAFTADGIIYAEGDKIPVEVFGGNKEAFSAAVAKGMITNVGTDTASASTNAGITSGAGIKGASAESFGKRPKEVLEKIAGALKIDTNGKKKDEIVSALNDFHG